MKTSNKSKFYLTIFLLLISFSLMAQVESGKKIPYVTLEGKNGGDINGLPWSSENLNGRVNLLFYAAPSQQAELQPLLKKIDQKDYPPEKISVGIIINADATWIPNSVIESKIKNKAEKDPDKIYALDKKGILLKQLELSGDNLNILVVDENSIVTFFYKDELNEIIENNLINHIEYLINKGD